MTHQGGLHEESTSAFSIFPSDQFNGINFNEISHGDSAKNPFLNPPAPQSPLKKNSPAKLFHNTAEIIMATKNNRYDVFKNDKAPLSDDNSPRKSDDPFQDFAKAAFSEFKVDKMMSGHEFSNKLSDARSFQQPMNAKVNLTYM